MDERVLVGAVRENLEPVKTRRRAEWKEDSPSFVWTAGDALSNMLAVLERRCLEGRMHGMGHPPLDSAYPARLDDVAQFTDGGVDVQRMVDLALPLSFIRYRSRGAEEPGSQRGMPHAPRTLPSAYAAMKLTLLPGKFDCPSLGSAGRDIWMEPALPARLRAGRVGDAHQIASRRLRASGLQPLSNAPGMADRSEQGRRLAAALLFPLGQDSHQGLAERAVRIPVEANGT